MGNVFSIHIFKKNNRELLFNKLKNWGYAFHKLNYKKERSIKICKFLNNGLLGWTHSSELKEGVFIDLFIFADKIELKIKGEIIKEIKDWESDMNNSFISISNTYDKYFYEKEEVLEYYKKRKDILEIERLLDSIYPELKVRKINKECDYFSILIGSSVVSYLIEKKSDNNKKIVLNSYFLSKNKKMYNRGCYSLLPQKYKKYVKSYYNHEISNLSLKFLKNIHNRLKNIK